MALVSPRCHCRTPGPCPWAGRTRGSANRRAQAQTAKAARGQAGLWPCTLTNVDGRPDRKAGLNETDLRLDSGILASIACELDRCKADDGRVGPARVLPSVPAILNVVNQHTRDTRSCLLRGLLTVGAGAAEFTGL